MGYETIQNSKLGYLPANKVRLRNFRAGWWPGKAHDEIPGLLSEPLQPVGADDCDATVWYEGALRKMFGYESVTTSALNGVPTSLFYSYILGNLVGTAGSKIYSTLTSATPTDITDVVVVTGGNQVAWTEWQFSTTKMVIGTNGVNPVFKWIGSGNAAVLGGSPPKARWVTNWRDVIWLANIENKPQQVVFSNIGDPETWSADDNYNFDSPITGISPYGDMLVVFMDDHIGIMSGSNNRQLVKIDRYIDGIGCTGGHTIVSASLNGKDVLIFHARDGWYAFDGTRQKIKLSSPIAIKYSSSSSAQRWNEARYTNAVATWYPEFHWVMTCLTDGGGSANDFMVIKDLSQVLPDSQVNLPTDTGGYIAHWPFDGIPANCIETVPVTGRNTIYFGNNSDNKIHKFNPSVLTKNGTAYTNYFTSKVFDMGASSIIQETNVLGEDKTNSTALNVYINTRLQGDGELGQTNFETGGDELDSTFILDTSQLGGSQFAYKNIQASDFGQFLQFTLENDQSGQTMTTYGIDFILQGLGLESNVPST